MRFRILCVLMFFSFVAAAQPTNYTRIANRYRWISGMFDSALYVPRYNGTPSGVRVNETSVFDGMIAMDTTNNRLYIYSGGAWVRLANYSEATYTAGNGLTLSGSQFKLGGTLVDATTTVDADNKDITISNIGLFQILGTGAAVKIAVADDVTEINGGTPSVLSTITVDDTITLSSLTKSILSIGNRVSINPYQNQLYIDSLNYTLSTTGKKIMLRDTASGLVQNIDPALLGASPGGSTKQFQYNNAGAFAGSGMLTQETDQILITGNSAASTPPFEVNAHEDLTAEIINVKQSGTKKFSFHSNGSIEMAETTDPTAAATGYNRLYAQAGKLYTHNDDGRVAQVIQNLQLVFGAGSGADADTTAFTTSAIYGSFYNDADTIVVTSFKAVLQGTSPDVTYKVWYNDSLNVEAGATALVTAGSQVTNTTTGTNVTSFDVTKIPPGVWVWVKISTVATKPKYFSLTLNGYRK